MSSDARYVELHCHSNFSLLDGASSPEELVARAHELGHPALALTDHDELGGVVRFAQAAGEMEIGAIIGSELTVGKHHIVLLAESREGYGNLSALITRARMDSERGNPSVSLDQLAERARGLFALTGCPRGWVPSLVAAGDIDAAVEATAMLKDIFEGRVAIECWDHHLPEERATVRGLIPIARALDIPWVVTNDVHYARPATRIVHDVLSCLRHEKTLDEMGTRLRPNGEWYLKSAAQMRRRWQHDDAGIRATLTIAERCAFRMEQLKPHMPKFPLPPGVTDDEYLERLVEQGAYERWGDARTEAHTKQLRHELAIIESLNLAGYFLIVWDIVRFARRQGILCQGRGSAANSAVCYCLGITAVDPIRMELLFERFLSEERKEAPDIDIDFSHRDREQVLQYVYERYGREHAAMVCEQITYRGRSAVRDAARVLGFSVEQASMLSLLSDRFSARATAELLRGDQDQFDESPAEERREPKGTSGHWHEGEGAPALKSRNRRDAESAESSQRHRDDLDDDDEDDRIDPSTRARPRDMKPGWTPRRPMPQADDEEGVSGRQKYYHWGPDPLSTREMADLLKPVEAPQSPTVADAMSMNLLHGTAATTHANAIKYASRKITRYDRDEQAARKMTTADRPKPNASYEPYGSPSAQDSGAGTKRAPWMDQHAKETHNERRNPTTAFRATNDRDGVLVRAGLDPADRRVQMLAMIVQGLHQAPRHRSIHVGGFVLTEEPLSTVVPIEPASMKDRTVIQWEKDDLDPVGLVKIDLLGLGMLTVIQDCLKYIRATRGVTIDLGQLDMTDQAVYDDLCRADTIGIFQVESRAQMNTLPRLKPRCFYDLVVEVALIRPGPIQGDMVHPYLRRRAGLEPVTYPHPTLEPILRRTLGVPLFQEQGMQVAIACAGFTPGDADNLRRAMGHKRSRERMATICERLIEGMKKNGIPEDIATRIYNQINAFADYGFPESHAASFALLVYASAYLKHYYAPEFTAAMLNAQPMGFYAPGTLIEDAKRHGVVVRPVDLSRSRWDCTLEGPAARPVKPRGAPPEKQSRDGGASEHHHSDASTTRLPRRPAPSPAPPALRLGLRSVKGLGDKARRQLEAALAQGPFTSVADVVHRAGLDRRSLRYLAEAGAFDRFVEGGPLETRRAALWKMLEELRGIAGPLAPAPPSVSKTDLPAMSPFELTEADYRMTGISLNGHPMSHLRPVLAMNRIRSAREVSRSRDGDRIGVAGLVICRQRPGTAKGFVFLTLEDETGMVNVVVTPKRFEQQALLISTEPLLLVRGTLQIEEGVINLKGESFRALKAQVGAEHARRHDFH